MGHGSKVLFFSFLPIGNTIVNREDVVQGRHCPVGEGGPISYSGGYSGILKCVVMVSVMVG